MTYTSQIETSFSGISDLTSNPPHNALAAGPGYIVTSEGARIAWTDLSGGSEVLQSIYQFFAPLGPTATNALFDPRAVFDPVNGRYVVTVDNIGSNGTISNIDVAVSKDSNPNDGWYFVSLNTSLTINGQLTSSDQPTVSVDGTNIYITAPQYYVAGGYAGTEAWVISDTAGSGGGVYNGGALTVVANEVTSPAQNIYRVVAGNNGKSYYADAYSSGSQTIVNVQVYDLATNTFGSTTTLALGNSDQGNGGSGFTAQQQGTTLLLDAGDSNLQNLAYANGFLYGVSEVKPAGSSVPLVHWFQIDVSNPANPTLVAQGDISGAAIGSNVATFDGSIAVDGAGDIIINFAASGPNMYPSDYYVYRGATDPLNAFSAPVLYQASSGFFNSGNGSSVQRFGPNSSATADATDPTRSGSRANMSPTAGGRLRWRRSRSRRLPTPRPTKTLRSAAAWRRWFPPGLPSRPAPSRARTGPPSRSRPTAAIAMTQPASLPSNRFASSRRSSTASPTHRPTARASAPAAS